MACIFPSQEIPFFLSATAFSPFFLTEEFSFLLSLTFLRIFFHSLFHPISGKTEKVPFYQNKRKEIRVKGK